MYFQTLRRPVVSLIAGAVILFAAFAQISEQGSLHAGGMVKAPTKSTQVAPGR
jgi:hypothetical protein